MTNIGRSEGNVNEFAVKNSLISLIIMCMIFSYFFVFRCNFGSYYHPKFKVEVYKWLYDCLLKYRNDSGDSFKKMCGALYYNATNRVRFSEAMKMLCDRIKVEVGVTDDWQSANENQLKYRDKIHEYIALMCGIFHNNNNEAVRVGIKKAREWKESNLSRNYPL